MELVPDDLQRHIILTFDVKDGSAESDAETNVAPSSEAEVKLQIDRSKLLSSSAPIHETLSMQGPNKGLFVDIWKRIWLQDYMNHAATGSARGFATKGWMPMQLRGLRESFAQILTDTNTILFRATSTSRIPGIS